jgi:hypothetical protein
VNLIQESQRVWTVDGYQNAYLEIGTQGPACQMANTLDL